MSLRTEIGKAIVKAFNEDTHHVMDFDPDTCYRAADEVVALLMSRLTGLELVGRTRKRLSRIWRKPGFTSTMRFNSLRENEKYEKTPTS